MREIATLWRCHDPVTHSLAHRIPEDINLAIKIAVMNSVHTKTGPGLTGQTLPLDVGQELDKDEELLAVATETLDYYPIVDEQKVDEDRLSHLSGNCHCDLPARNGDVARPYRHC